jgi:hypothetical protein
VGECLDGLQAGLAGGGGEVGSGSGHAGDWRFTWESVAEGGGARAEQCYGIVTELPMLRDIIVRLWRGSF